jgi:hypothetical protein
LNNSGQSIKPDTFFGDIVGAYADFSLSFVKQKNKAFGERRVLLLSFVSAVILLMSRLPYQISLWHISEHRDSFLTVLGVLFFVTIFFVPLLLYLVSMILHFFFKNVFWNGYTL